MNSKRMVNIKTNITNVTSKVVFTVLIVILHLANHNPNVNKHKRRVHRVFLCEVHVVGQFSPRGKSFSTSFTSAREGGGEKTGPCNICLYV